MKKSPWRLVGLVTVLLAMGGLVAVGTTCSHFILPQTVKVDQPSVLVLKLEGVIIDGEKFLKNLRKYREMEDVKAILVRVNSPGGVVGPSQEFFTELKRTRDVYKKPVVFSANALMASGAYYAAVGASKIVVNSGTLMGSIGVIMEFANLKELYKWAKIERYSLKTGPLKDTGADYRDMRPEEKVYMENLLSEVHMQFKKAVAEGRSLPLEKVEKYSDGRVFTGETGVKLGFADQVGSYDDAIKLVGQLAGLGDDPELFEPAKERPNFFEFFQEEEDEYSKFSKSLGKFIGLEYVGVPLFLWPGARFSSLTN